MIIIGFSTKTSKILPRILCKHFKHCAPIIKVGENFLMYQFVKHNDIKAIPITSYGLKLLKGAGWKFIKTNLKPAKYPKSYNAVTCVCFTKKFIGIHAPFIQTPDALYRKLKRPKGRFII